MSPDRPQGDILSHLAATERSAVSHVDLRVRLVYFVLGSAGLLPSTLLVTAMPFFQSRVLGSTFGATFSSYLFMAYNASAFIFLAHATAVSNSSLPTRQTRLTILALLALTFLTTVSALVETAPSSFFIFIMFIAILYGAAVSYFQTPVFAVASIFGAGAVQASMAGQAAVGVVVNLVNLISAAISLDLDKDTSTQTKRTPEETAAFISFAFTTCVLCISLIAHSWLVRTPAYKSLIEPIEQKMEASGQPEETRTLLPSDPSTTIISERDTAMRRLIRVARVNILYEIAVAYVFLITLSVFPPITAAIRPVNPWFHPLLFNAIHVLLFCLGDLFGRHLCSFPSLLIWSPHRLLGLSLAHTLFIPLFIACNIQLVPLSIVQPSFYMYILGSTPLIDSDLLFFFILFAFGTSNGYVSTLCIMSAPSLEHNKRLEDQEDVNTAATVSLFCMVGGMTVGSFASFAIRMIVCKCNPFVG